MLHDARAASELLNPRDRARPDVVISHGLFAEGTRDDAESLASVTFAVVTRVEVGASVAHLPLVMQAAVAAEVGGLFASLHSARHATVHPGGNGSMIW